MITMLGKKAPDFSLESSNGLSVSLDQLRGSFVVLIFYPANDTPTCDRQLAEANLNLQEFLQSNARVFGVNTASTAKQKEYCQRKRLEFPILSDPGGRVARQFKAHTWWLPLNRRTVVVVNPQGNICFYKRGFPTAEEILSAIKNAAAQSDSG